MPFGLLSSPILGDAFAPIYARYLLAANRPAFHLVQFLLDGALVGVISRRVRRGVRDYRVQSSPSNEAKRLTPQAVGVPVLHVFDPDLELRRQLTGARQDPNGHLILPQPRWRRRPGTAGFRFHRHVAVRLGMRYKLCWIKRRIA